MEWGGYILNPLFTAKVWFSTKISCFNSFILFLCHTFIVQILLVHPSSSFPPSPSACPDNTHQCLPIHDMYKVDTTLTLNVLTTDICLSLQEMFVFLGTMTICWVLTQRVNVLYYIKVEDVLISNTIQVNKWWTVKDDRMYKGQMTSIIGWRSSSNWSLDNLVTEIRALIFLSKNSQRSIENLKKEIGNTIPMLKLIFKKKIQMNMYKDLFQKIFLIAEIERLIH